jgi:hypothetical protein
VIKVDKAVFSHQGYFGTAALRDKCFFQFLKLFDCAALSTCLSVISSNDFTTLLPDLLFVLCFINLKKISFWRLPK